jgi:hypothetical protein
MAYDKKTIPTQQEQGQQAFETGFNATKSGVLAVLEQRKTILAPNCPNRFMEVVECEKLVTALVPGTGSNFAAGCGALSLAVYEMLQQRRNEIARYSSPVDHLAEMKVLNDLLIEEIDF